MADLVVVPGPNAHQHFAAYPMTQVLMWRWGFHRPGTWKISIFIDSGFDIVDRVAVMDDFGTLVVVAHG